MRRTRDLVVSPARVPLPEGAAGAYVGLDLDPGPEGVAGRVINFGGREFRKHVLAPDVGRFLLWLAAEFERRNWRLDEVDGGAVLALRDPPVDHFLDSLPRRGSPRPGDGPQERDRDEGGAGRGPDGDSGAPSPHLPPMSAPTPRCRRTA